jgi:hypothetical protein
MTVTASDGDAFAAANERLERDLATPRLDELVSAYYDPALGFAGATFDALGVNPRNEITRDDLLAVTLLDGRWTASAVRRLLGADSAQATALLVRISSATSLWEASDQRLAAIDPLWDLLTSGRDGVGQTLASKLLARKRPRLVPITDKIIVARVDTAGQTWKALRYCFQDASLRQAIEALRPRQATTASVLRLLDAALWMLYSNLPPMDHPPSLGCVSLAPLLGTRSCKGVPASSSRVAFRRGRRSQSRQRLCPRRLRRWRKRQPQRDLVRRGLGAYPGAGAASSASGHSLSGSSSRSRCDE